MKQPVPSNTAIFPLARVGDWVRSKETGLVFQVSAISGDGEQVQYFHGADGYLAVECDRATWREGVIDDLNRTLAQWPEGSLAASAAVAWLETVFQDPQVALFKADWWNGLTQKEKEKIHGFYNEIRH